MRGPKHVVKTGKTPVLEGAEWRKLLDSIPATTLRDLRDRALIADAGDAASWRYVEFATRTRAAPTPARAAGSSPGARIADLR